MPKKEECLQCKKAKQSGYGLKCSYYGRQPNYDENTCSHWQVSNTIEDAGNEGTGGIAGKTEFIVSNSHVEDAGFPKKTNENNIKLQCPHCAKTVEHISLKCPHCGEWMSEFRPGTIRSKKYMTRTMWIITGIYTVAAITLGVLVSEYFFVALMMLSISLGMLLHDAIYGHSYIDVNNDEIVFGKCMLMGTNMLGRQKFYELQKFKMDSIKNVEFVNAGANGIFLRVNDGDFPVNLFLFKRKDVNLLCNLLCGKDMPKQRGQWIILIIALIIGVLIGLFKSGAL